MGSGSQGSAGSQTNLPDNSIEQNEKEWDRYADGEVGGLTGLDY